MFHGVAVVNHVQENDEKATFHVQAELNLSQDVIHAQLELQGVDNSVHATVLSNAKAGRNAFDISGNGASPFKVGNTIRAIGFEKGEVPWRPVTIWVDRTLSPPDGGPSDAFVKPHYPASPIPAPALANIRDTVAG